MLYYEYEKGDGPRAIDLYKREAHRAPDIVKVPLERYDLTTVTRVLANLYGGL